MDTLKKDKDKHLGLRIDSELHYKLHYISQYEGRSANGEVIYLIRKAIEDFEKQHGRKSYHYWRTLDDDPVISAYLPELKSKQPDADREKQHSHNAGKAVF